ncbi:hypothetical protein CK203_000011 [Vitis vinifera]|uniref:Uncharacterized protein n=1 Tax=Vitis vinifera TaxID=29760 RepID=A0A438KPX4_VITVI|nr:hypothetical protein CK203_000011 [Vitis vinifera]
MASIQEAITSLGQRMDGQQAQQSQTEVAPPPTMVVVPTLEDAHAHMDKLEQRMRQLRVSDGGMYRPPVPFRPMSPTYLHPAPQPVYATQAALRPPAHYSYPRPPPAHRQMRQFPNSREEVRKENNEILRQLQSTQAQISIWSLLATSSTHRDALLRALIACSGHRVLSFLLDNGSSLNVCPLATPIALGFAPSDFGPSIQTMRAYDNT